MSKESEKIIDKIMENISIKESDDYGYWNVVYKDNIIDQYNTDTMVINKLIEEDSEDYDIEDAIKYDFRERLERAYKKDKIKGIDTVLSFRF